jgi:hypothetical protein
MLSCWSDPNHIEIFSTFFILTNLTKLTFFWRLALFSFFFFFFFFLINGTYKFLSRHLTIVKRKYVYLGRIKNFTHVITYLNIRNGLILISHIITIIMKVDKQQS